MSTRIARILGLGSALALPLTLAAQDAPTLSIGDEAPALDIAHWIKGDVVEDFEDGNVYIVEFWATWCGPCRTSMPHIASLQEQYKDYNVQFIGISDEDLPKVFSFLTSQHPEGSTWNDVTAYTMATDPDKSVYTDYMKAAGQNGIPTAFIVGKDQHIEWIGHPMEIDKPLEMVVHDSWDREAHKAEFDAMAAIQKHFRAGEMEEAVAAIDAFLAKHESSRLTITKFNLLVGPMNREADAFAMGDQLLKACWDDAQMLNAVSWRVLTSPEIENPDLDFAMKAAERACELTEHEDAMILDTLARAWYEKGDLAKAIHWQKIAVEHAPKDEMGQSISDTLAEYEREQSEGG